jgi:nucleoside-diphosphate-sugar epimerase
MPGDDPSTILVTGGTGFLGRSLVNKLVAEGQSVRVLSRSGKNSAHPRISMYRGDLTCVKDLKVIVQGCKLIFHCAGEKTDEKMMTAVNVMATKHLLEVASDERIRYFCHLSSIGVVGKTRLKLVDESTACNPTNQYETTKLAAEEIVNRGVSDGRVVILRPTNIFSAETLRPMLRGSFRSRIGAFLKGNESAHFVYIKDVVAAAMYWMQAPSQRSVDTYIVSSDGESGNSNRDIQALLSSRIHTAPQPSKMSAPLLVPYCARLLRHGKSNYGNVTYSSRKIYESGFRFPYGLKAGLNDAVDSLLESHSACGVHQGHI